MLRSAIQENRRTQDGIENHNIPKGKINEVRNNTKQENYGAVAVREINENKSNSRSVLGHL